MEEKKELNKASSGGNITKEVTLALTSLITGVLSLCAWVFPICGFPTSLAAIITGAMGLKSKDKKWMAITGIILGILGFIASTANAVAGVYIANNPEILTSFLETQY